MVRRVFTVQTFQSIVFPAYHRTGLSPTQHVRFADKPSDDT